MSIFRLLFLSFVMGAGKEDSHQNRVPIKTRFLKNVFPNVNYFHVFFFNMTEIIAAEI